MVVLNAALCLSILHLTSAAVVRREGEAASSSSLTPVPTATPTIPLQKPSSTLVNDPNDPDNVDFWKEFNVSNVAKLEVTGDKQAPITVTLVDLDGKDPETVEFYIPSTMTIPASTSVVLPTSTPVDKLTCNDPAQNAHAYISLDDMEAYATKFCDEEVNGKDKADLNKVYNEDTYDGAKLYIKTGKKIGSIECKERMKRIIHGCVPAANNPMNWKYGGELEFAGTTYKIEIFGDRSRNRVTEQDGGPMKAPRGNCDSFYQLVRDEFWIYGAGWKGGSNVQNVLHDQMAHCVPSLWDWEFTYYDKPRDDGIEWKAFGHTPIWQKNCFSPVIKGSGGPDVPCNGSG